MVGFRVLGVVKRKTHLRRESFEIATQTFFFFFFPLILMLVLFLVRNSQLMIDIKTCQNLVDKALILLLPSFKEEWELEKGNLGLEVWLLNC